MSFVCFQCVNKLSLIVWMAGHRPVRPIALLATILTRESQFRGFPQLFHRLGQLTLISSCEANVDGRRALYMYAWEWIFIHEVDGRAIDLGHWLSDGWSFNGWSLEGASIGPGASPPPPPFSPRRGVGC